MGNHLVLRFKSSGASGNMSSPYAAIKAITLGSRFRNFSLFLYLERLCEWASLVYLATALPTVLFLTVLTPPFQSPDEPNHFRRAASILSGSIVGQRSWIPGVSGAVIPKSVAEVSYAFFHLTGHPETKYSSASVQEALAMSWNRADEVYSDFSNTAIYPPFFYMPVVAALAVGRKFNWTVIASYRLARSINGAIAVALATLAIGLAGRGKGLLFVVLSLPTTLDLFGSTSQDALLIASVGLGAALCSRAAERPRRSTWPGRAIAALLFGAAMAARPPYAAFVVALAMPGTASNGPLVLSLVRRLWSPILALAVGLSWIVFGAAPAQVPMRIDDNVSILDQLAGLIRHPALFPRVLWHTLVTETPREIAHAIGVLGWSDGALPWASHAAAVVTLVVAALHASGLQVRSPARPWGWAVAVAMILALVGVHGALYLSWTPVGSNIVEGFQGRYMLPIATLAAVALPAIMARRSALPQPAVDRLDGLRDLGWASLFAFAVLSDLWLPFAVFDRYYA